MHNNWIRALPPLALLKARGPVLADTGSGAGGTPRRREEDADNVHARSSDFASAVAQANGWHFKMLRDEDRALKFDAALRKIVRPGSLVLDVGAGSGLLGLMANRLGGEVYACEANSSFAAAARRVIRENKADFPVIAKSSFRLEVPRDLPRKADVLVAEVLSSSLFGEGVLATFRDAHRRLLAPGAQVVPRRVRLHFAVVQWPAVYRGSSASAVAGFDLSAFNVFRAERRLLELPPMDSTVALLTEPTLALEVDLSDPQDPLLAEPANLERFFELPVVADGACQLVVVWWDATLDEAGEIVVSTDPFQPLPPFRHGHWGARGQALPLRQGGEAEIAARRGDTLHVRLTLQENRADPQPFFEIAVASG